jgi:hypothetical protein
VIEQLSKRLALYLEAKQEVKIVDILIALSKPIDGHLIFFRTSLEIDRKSQDRVTFDPIKCITKSASILFAN